MLDQAIDQHDNYNTMSSRRYLPSTPSPLPAVSVDNHSQLLSHSAIEDLFQIFENNGEFIRMGKRLLNKKRKLEQLRAQLTLPENLTGEDALKLLQLRERLKAKRRLGMSIHFMFVYSKTNRTIYLATVFIEPERPSVYNESTTLNRKASTSMPNLTPTAL